MRQTQKIHNLVYIALAIALMSICAWVQIPTAIPFTLQTFGVLTIAAILGPKRSFLAMLGYLLLGIFGLPIFSGFRSGAGVLFSATGGYIIGFLFTAPITGLLLVRLGHTTPALAFSMVIGLAVCYLFGTLWYTHVYANGNGFFAALTVCVMPFLPADICKIAGSVLLVQRLRPHLHLTQSTKSHHQEDVS